jgi:hypothetical protein
MSSVLLPKTLKSCQKLPIRTARLSELRRIPSRQTRAPAVFGPHLSVPIFLTCVAGVACVPSGTAPAWDGGARNAPKVIAQASDVLTAPFEDNFDDRQNVLDPPEATPLLSFTGAARSELPDAAPGLPGSRPMGEAKGLLALGRGDAARSLEAGMKTVLLQPSASASASALLASSSASAAARVDAAQMPPSRLGPNWYQSKTSAWSIENGRLCGRGAKNHGVWLKKPIPINARIEFDATSTSAEGDLKAELWGDGQSSATSESYNNATSYLAILGGWKNTVHVLARINEHGTDRKEIKVDKDSDDARQHPVSVGQTYRFKVERSDGKTVRWSVNGVEYAAWSDAEPLAGVGHDHFGFNNWEVKVCFDNVKVTPL